MTSFGGIALSEPLKSGGQEPPAPKLGGRGARGGEHWCVLRGLSPEPSCPAPAAAELSFVYSVAVVELHHIQ